MSRGQDLVERRQKVVAAGVGQFAGIDDETLNRGLDVMETAIAPAATRELSA